MKSEERFADNNFTALRLLLALLVVLGHFHLLAGEPSPPWPFCYAAAAVDCFFVVSGYLVSSSFDRDPNLKRFYVRRFFRIYPLYLAVVAAQTVILAALAPGGIWANGSSLLRYFLVNAVFANFLQHDVGDGVLTALNFADLNVSLWTLKIEFGFYLILPFLWQATRRFGVALLIGMFVLSAGYHEGLTLAGHYQFAKQLPGQLQFFVLGIAVYMFRDRLPLLSPAAGLGVMAVLAILVTALLRVHPPIIYPLLIAALVTVGALRTPRITLPADISYGVYLLHAPLIQLSLLVGIYQSGWAGIVATVILVLILATFAERVVEAPGIELGRRLSRRVETRGPGKRPAAPAPVVTGAPLPPNVSCDDMTVVVLNDFCYVQGGASAVAIDEAISLARSGIKVIFLGAVGPPCPQLRHSSVTVECLDQHELVDVGRHPAVALQGLWNVKAARRAQEILSTLPPERTIVHLHGYTKALTISPVRAARRLGFPVICTLHDFFAACPNGAFFDYGMERPCTRRALSADCIAAHCDKRHHAHKLFRVARGLIQRSCGLFPRDVRHYISLSERSAAVLGPYLPPQARLHRLPNVTDAPREPPVPVSRNRTVLYVGRLDAEKGVRLLAQVVKQLGLRATFVGDGPLRAEVEAISDAVVTGWVSREEVRQHLASARCLVFPSLWYETYGLTVAEAAARGIPAVVSDISAAAERVEEGVSGWRFRSGDSADLARCLRLIENDTLVQEAGNGAYRAFWAAPTTWERHASDLIRIYRSALQCEAAI